jgi:hypothetical protein
VESEVRVRVGDRKVVERVEGRVVERMGTLEKEHFPTDMAGFPQVGWKRVVGSGR